jgi:flavodoxin
VIYCKQWLDKLKYTEYGFTKYTAEELAEATKKAGFQVKIVPIQKGKSYAVVAHKYNGTASFPA